MQKKSRIKIEIPENLVKNNTHSFFFIRDKYCNLHAFEGFSDTSFCFLGYNLCKAPCFVGNLPRYAMQHEDRDKNTSAAWSTKHPAKIRPVFLLFEF